MNADARKAKRARNRVIATDFVRQINADTPCAHCQGGPIEWHGEHHPDKPNSRVSSLRSQGASIQRIMEEMKLCVPLCRSCHMKEDGRGAALFANQPNQPGAVIVPPKPCRCCSKTTKPTRNSMCVTCDNHHSGRRRRKMKSCDGCFDLAVPDRHNPEKTP